MNTKHVINLLLGATFATFSLVACNKDDDATPLPEKVQKLLKADWKIDNITVPSKTNPAEDSTLLNACMADDIIKFSTVGYDFQDAANKCDTSVFPYFKGSFTFDVAQDSIFLSTANVNKPIRWKVALLTDTELRINWWDSISPTNKQLKTIKMKH